MPVPTATLMLERCAQAIEQVILPHLTDPFALEQATYTSMVLRFLAPAVEDKCEELIAENNGMRGIIERVVEVLRGEKPLSRNKVSNGLLKKLGCAMEKPNGKQPALIEENHTLKIALMETINGLDALADELPLETVSPLRQQIRSLIRQQLNYKIARIEALAEARAAAGIIPLGFFTKTQE